MRAADAPRAASSINRSSTRCSCTGGTKGWMIKTSRSRQLTCRNAQRFIPVKPHAHEGPHAQGDIGEARASVDEQSSQAIADVLTEMAAGRASGSLGDRDHGGRL